MNIIEVNFEKLRLDRQYNNISNVNNILKNKNITELYKNINKKQLSVILKRFNWTIEQLLDKCEKDYDFSYLLSFQIAKNSSRQGSLDENKQIEICSKYCSLYDIKFYKLKKTLLLFKKWRYRI